MGQAMSKADKPKKGSFFIVDRPTFAKVCDLGDPDLAAAYLVLAAGTGADNRTSSWSREAINRRTALNWRKANDCIAKLEKQGLAEWIGNTKGTGNPGFICPPSRRAIRCRLGSRGSPHKYTEASIPWTAPN